MHIIFYIILIVFILLAMAVYIFRPIEPLLDFLFPKKIVHGPDGSPYMHRWFIFRTRNVALFCHKFVRSDYDRALHDHPWDFLVIPLWRGYIEHSAYINDFLSTRERLEIGERALMDKSKRRVWPIIGTRFRRAEFVHRVELISKQVITGCRFGDSSKGEPNVVCLYAEEFLPSWSLFFRFKKRRHWGFWCPKSWRPWVEGKPDHCGENDQPYVQRHTGAEDVV